jgi:hypothetical protein
VNQTFATQPNTPAPGISLYRFSAGHGGLQCSACHGSTHAEFPATHRNDNVRNEQLQGHAGVMIECTACHVSMSVNNSTARGGPHGMHPVGSNWVKDHHDFIGSFANCQVCHGVDYRGTPLSRVQASRNITVNLNGTPVSFPTFKGAEVGCYNCHNGPSSENANTTANPIANNLTTNTINNQPLTFALPVSGDGAAGHIISQPAHGSVGLSNNVATYFPEPGFGGSDTFTFAAWNGSKNSTLATGTVAVAQGPVSISAKTLVPPSYAANWPAPFSVVTAVVNLAAPPTFDWDFGDGSAHASSQFATHTYSAPGSYAWKVVSGVSSGGSSASATNSGTIVVTGQMLVGVHSTGGNVTLTWPTIAGDVVVEGSPDLGAQANWQPVPGQPTTDGGTISLTVEQGDAKKFFRIRQVR